MTRSVLQLAFIGADRRSFVERALACGLLPAEAPSSIKIDLKKVSSNKPLAELAATSGDLAVAWGDGARLHSNLRRDRLFVDRSPWEVTIEGTLSLVRDLPFAACTTSPLDPSWWPGHDTKHGWALLLRGNGHGLVSGRVLERGPWRRVRDEAADVTLVQLHDLSADADTALAQARPGHALLEPMWTGGHYADSEAAFRGGVATVRYEPSFYDKRTRTSIVLVQEREVSRAEMGVAAATRVHQIFPEPVEQVAFVYMDEAVARRQLPALWTYGLEVRAMTAQGERRLDGDYEPPPAEVPAWVARLTDRP